MQGPDAIAPYAISFPLSIYGEMMTAMKLPLLGVEASAIVGPFFWWNLLEDDDDTFIREFLCPRV